MNSVLQNSIAQLPATEQLELAQWILGSVQAQLNESSIPDLTPFELRQALQRPSNNPRDGHEVARVSPMPQKPNRIGFLKGKIQMSDDFDATPQEMIDSLAKPTLKELLLSDKGRTDFLIPQRGHAKRRKIEVIE